MKQKDITLIIVVAVVSLILAIVGSKMLFGGSEISSQSAEVVEPISATFAPASSKYFNNDSVDPTEVIRIGDSENEAPFNQSDQ